MLLLTNICGLSQVLLVDSIGVFLRFGTGERASSECRAHALGIAQAARKFARKKNRQQEKLTS
jgi:hypothetical protein